jgi:hypothetical protein
MSALPERGKVARLGVEQGTLAIPDGGDNDKIAVGPIEANWLFASPGRHALWRAQQPTVQMADKQALLQLRPGITAQIELKPPTLLGSDGHPGSRLRR